MYLASADFSALHASCSGAPLALLLLCFLSVAPALVMGFVARFSARAMTQDTGVFRVARDGRSFIQIGRVCTFGRKGESEASLRARTVLS